MEILDNFASSFWLRIGAAVICGGMIGFERQIRDKPAGIRTSILICVGTTIFVRLGSGFDATSADPTRVLGQVVTGIGFLGAGVILARGEMITGVTTASVVWLLAAIGATIGLGYIIDAFALSILTVTLLFGIRLLERIFTRLRRGSGQSGSEETSH